MDNHPLLEHSQKLKSTKRLVSYLYDVFKNRKEKHAAIGAVSVWFREFDRLGVELD